MSGVSRGPALDLPEVLITLAPFIPGLLRAHGTAVTAGGVPLMVLEGELALHSPLAADHLTFKMLGAAAEAGFMPSLTFDGLWRCQLHPLGWLGFYADGFDDNYPALHAVAGALLAACGRMNRVLDGDS